MVYYSFLFFSHLLAVIIVTGLWGFPPFRYRCSTCIPFRWVHLLIPEGKQLLKTELNLLECVSSRILLFGVAKAYWFVSFMLNGRVKYDY